MPNFREREELNALKWALWFYVLIFALKIGAYFFTGVLALLAEALNSLGDIFISAFLFLAVKLSRKGADENHMFGHGRAQNVAALAAATFFLSFTSYHIYKEAILALIRPSARHYENLGLALEIIILSMILTMIPLVKLKRQKKRGAALKAQLVDLINDELSLLAALIGTVFIMFGRPIADPIAAFIVATIIAAKAVELFRENLSILLGQSPGPDFLAKVEKAALSIPGVLGIHELRAEYIGLDTVHAVMHILVKRGTPIEEADRIAQEVRAKIHDETNGLYCIIHVDPAD